MVMRQRSVRVRWGLTSRETVRLGGVRRASVNTCVADPLPPLTTSAVLVKAFQSLVQALRAKDPYTASHSLRVSAYSKAMAQEMKLASDITRQIELGGELHDVGKIGVPERLLTKNGPLLEHEYRQVMQHTLIGVTILAPLLAEYPTVLEVVRSHHERFDGGGGPDRLRGDEIPLAARIVAVADAFDAMTSTRPYRESMTAHAALNELRKNAGLQFDPRCVRALVMAISRTTKSRPARRHGSARRSSGRVLPLRRRDRVGRTTSAPMSGRVPNALARTALLDKRVNLRRCSSRSLLGCA